MSLEATNPEIITQNLERFLMVFSVSLAVAALSRSWAIFRKIPYTLLLVIVGIGLAFVDVRLVNLSPQLILEIFLPPLLFEATWNLSWKNLKSNWLLITLFAIFGVLISIIGIGFSLHQWAGLTLPIALLIGAALAATDPVSVIALFKVLGASKKLTILMEGESLFNDGVAVVAFVLLVGIPLGMDSLSVSQILGNFFAVVGIGVGVGCVIGFGISFITQRFDIPLVEQSLTLVSAYGTYLITEELGGSGVIAVVIVGIILGNWGSRIGMSPRTRLIVTEFWEFLAFFVNSMIFLLIGDQIQFASLGSHLHLIVVAIVASLVTRLIGIYGLSFLNNAIANSRVTFQEQAVLWWGGLRGSVSIALALSVPEIIAERQEIIDIVFGVVFFTLLVQGLSIQGLLKGLNLIGDQPIRQKYSELIARKVAMQRVLDYFDKVKQFPDLEPEFYRYKQQLVEGELNSIKHKFQRLLQEYPQLQEMAMEEFQETLLDIEADTYAELIQLGRLNENLALVLMEAVAEEQE